MLFNLEKSSSCIYYSSCSAHIHTYIQYISDKISDTKIPSINIHIIQEYLYLSIYLYSYEISYGTFLVGKSFCIPQFKKSSILPMYISLVHIHI